MKLRAIIVTHNSAQTIADCLDSALAAVGKLDASITVVDNDSADNTISIIQDRFSDVEIVKQGNIGFAAANNVVLQRDDCDYALLLNPDTRLDSDAVSILLESLQSGKDIALVGPRVRYAGGAPQVSFGSSPGFFSDLRQRRFIQDSHLGEPGAVNRLNSLMEAPFLPDWISGSCFVARMEALRQVNYFDEDFFLYLEDVDLCKRLSLAGWSVMVQPKAGCIHLEGQSIGDKQIRVDHFRKSRLLYENKHGSRFGFFLYKLLRARTTELDYDPDKKYRQTSEVKR